MLGNVDEKGVLLVNNARKCLDEAIKMGILYLDSQARSLVPEFGEYDSKSGRCRWIFGRKNVLRPWNQQSISLSTQRATLCKEQGCRDNAAWTYVYH